MEAWGGMGLEMAPAEPNGEEVEIPSLEVNATLRDIASYMKAFKTSVHGLELDIKRRVATSIVKALESRPLTTDTLNNLIQDPTVPRTFSQPEGKLIAMEKAKSTSNAAPPAPDANPNADAGRAGTTAEAHGPSNTAGSLPPSQPAPQTTAETAPQTTPQTTTQTTTQTTPQSMAQPASSGTAAPQLAPGQMPGTSTEEWRILQGVRPEDRTGALYGMRLLHKQQMIAYAQLPHMQYPVMPGYPPMMPPQPGVMPGSPPNQQQQPQGTAPKSQNPQQPMPGYPMPHPPHAGMPGYPMPHPQMGMPPYGYPPPFPPHPHMVPPQYGAAMYPGHYPPGFVPATPNGSNGSTTVHASPAPAGQQATGQQATGQQTAGAGTNAMHAPQQPPAPKKKRTEPLAKPRPGSSANVPQIVQALSPQSPTPQGVQSRKTKGAKNSKPRANAGKTQARASGKSGAASKKTSHSGPVIEILDNDSDTAEKDTNQSTQSGETTRSVLESALFIPNTVGPIEKDDINQTVTGTGNATAAVEGAKGNFVNQHNKESAAPDADTTSQVNEDEDDTASRRSQARKDASTLFGEGFQPQRSPSSDSPFHLFLNDMLSQQRGENPPSVDALQSGAPGTNNMPAETPVGPDKQPERDTRATESPDNLDISNFEPNDIDALFDEQGDWLSDDQLEEQIRKQIDEKRAQTAASQLTDASIAKLLTEAAAENTTGEMARAQATANNGAAAASEQGGGRNPSSTSTEAENADPAPGTTSHNLASNPTNVAAGANIVAAKNSKQDSATETEPQKPCDCEQCGRSGLQSTCCLENLTRQHPDALSFLQPMVRHNCIVYDRNVTTDPTDIGKPVIALYPELIGKAAEVRFSDEALTVMQAPIVQIPDHLRFVPSMTVFDGGASFANDPIGMVEYCFTGRVIADGEAGRIDPDLAKYRGFWGETGPNAIIGRKEAEANKLIGLYNEHGGLGQTSEQKKEFAKQLKKRSLDAIDHIPGSGHTCGAGDNQFLVYNPRLLPKYVEDENVQLSKAIATANTLNMMQNGITPELRSYIPMDLTDLEARQKVPFTKIVRLAHDPQIFDLIPDAAHMRKDRGIKGKQYLPFGSKMLVILALELRRQRLRNDDEVFSTLRRLVPHFETMGFTEKDLTIWRMQLLQNEEYLEFYWVVRSVIRKDFRGIKLLQMIWANDERLFDTKRDDEMDTLGLVLTMEEMLRIAGKVIEAETKERNRRAEEAATNQHKRRAEDDESEPSAKRVKA